MRKLFLIGVLVGAVVGSFQSYASADCKHVVLTDPDGLPLPSKFPVDHSTVGNDDHACSGVGGGGGVGVAPPLPPTHDSTDGTKSDAKCGSDGSMVGVCKDCPYYVNGKCQWACSGGKTCNDGKNPFAPIIRVCYTSSDCNVPGF